MTPPFSSLSCTSQVVAFVLSTAAAIVLMLWVSRLGENLKTDEAPQGIVSLELAWSAARVDAILGSWDESKRAIAVRQTLWDYLFLVAYPIAFSLSCVLISRCAFSSLKEFGIVLAWTVLFAGVLDAIENVCLLAMLHGGARSGLSQVATICASFKFALLFAVVGYWTLAALQSLSAFVRFAGGRVAR